MYFWYRSKAVLVIFSFIWSRVWKWVMRSKLSASSSLLCMALYVVCYLATPLNACYCLQTDLWNLIVLLWVDQMAAVGVKWFGICYRYQGWRVLIGSSSIQWWAMWPTFKISLDWYSVLRKHYTLPEVLKVVKVDILYYMCVFYDWPARDLIAWIGTMKCAVKMWRLISRMCSVFGSV